MIISILNEKGGVGKTTLSVNIAHAMKLNGYKTLLVDSDTQGSAREWHVRNDGELLDLISLDVPTIAKDIKQFSSIYDRIIIDGAGWGSVDSKSVDMAIKTIMCSDIVLIPLQPSPFDLWGLGNIIELVKTRIEITEGKLKAALILTQALKQAIITKEMKDELREVNMPLLSTVIHRRVVYATSAFEGKTVLLGNDELAKKEIMDLVEEIENVIKS